MGDNLILIEKSQGIATVTMNRPDALNALSGALRQAIAETFDQLREDTATEVIILTGAGRAFTVGLDLKELGGEVASSKNDAITDRDLGEAIANVGKPVIGAVNGFAITGGFEIALMCDFIIASTSAIEVPMIVNSSAPSPKTSLRICHNRLNDSSSPIVNSSRMIPNSANIARESGSDMVTAVSHLISGVSAPSP